MAKRIREKERKVQKLKNEKFKTVFTATLKKKRSTKNQAKWHTQTKHKEDKNTNKENETETITRNNRNKRYIRTKEKTLDKERNLKRDKTRRKNGGSTKWNKPMTNNEQNEKKKKNTQSISTTPFENEIQLIFPKKNEDKNVYCAIKNYRKN